MMQRRPAWRGRLSCDHSALLRLLARHRASAGCSSSATRESSAPASRRVHRVSITGSSSSFPLSIICGAPDRLRRAFEHRLDTHRRRAEAVREFVPCSSRATRKHIDHNDARRPRLAPARHSRQTPHKRREMTGNDQHPRKTNGRRMPRIRWERPTTRKDQTARTACRGSGVRIPSGPPRKPLVRQGLFPSPRQRARGGGRCGIGTGRVALLVPWIRSICSRTSNGVP